MFIKTILITLCEQKINILDLLCIEVDGQFRIDEKKLKVLKQLILQHGIENIRQHLYQSINPILRNICFWEYIFANTGPGSIVNFRDLSLIQEIPLDNISGLRNSTFIKIVHQTYLTGVNIEDIVNVTSNNTIATQTDFEVLNNTIGTQTDFPPCGLDMYRDTSDYLFTLGADGEIATSSSDNN